MKTILLLVTILIILVALKRAIASFYKEAYRIETLIFSSKTGVSTEAYSAIQKLSKRKIKPRNSDHIVKLLLTMAEVKQKHNL